MSFTYRGLTAQLTRHTVTPEEVDHQLRRLVDTNPRIRVVTDRPTRSGDEVVLDYAGFCGDEQFAGGTAKNQTLVLGSGAFIPGFEEQLLDKVPGETVSVRVTFPKAYHAPELAGKEARFECVIHQIREKEPYQLDDTFAKEVGGCDTLEEMRTKLLQSLQSYTDQRGEMDLQDRLLRQAAATLDFTPSPQALEAAVDEQMEVLSGQLARQGLSMDMYCSFLHTSREDLRKDAYPTAEAELRCHAAVEEIARLEKLEVTQEEIGNALAVIARENGLTVEQLKPHYTPELEQSVIRSVLTTKVMELIRNAANIEIC